MVSFELCLKEEGKYLEDVVSRDYEDGKAASNLFSKVKEEFSEYLVSGNQEDQPFLYMKLSPIKTESNQAASFIPTACFKTEVSDQIVKFIEKN
ncbi:hypothetical protein V7195_21310 [Priestia megaterium]|uniref:hypothetical protein n=1 Tax=Priestia megaterium TaxID=1404 RepID=UPI00300AA2EF